MFKRPENDRRYIWTNHVVNKMVQYKISASLIKRIIRFPDRLEEGIAEKTSAVMKTATGTNKYSEIWVMYQLEKSRFKIITTWRYPAKSPVNNPVPPEIMIEITNLLNL